MLVRVLRGHSKGVDTVMFSHNGQDLLTASEAEGNACIWHCGNDFKDCQPMVLNCEISLYVFKP